MLVFTSCLANYIPKARVLAKSIKAFHPEWRFVLLLGEPWPSDESTLNDPFDEILYYEDLGIENLTQWLFKHGVMEICTAVKGFAVCHFFETYNSKKVLYLDPDIQVLNSLEQIDLLLDTYDILLVPHHLEPHSNLDMIVANELCQMRHGIYNLGFAAFAGREEGIKCAKWWRDRLYYFCRNDVARGLFTDQRWCDFIPSFFDNYHIIKDPGCDVASWNLTDRHVWKDKDGVLYANKTPVRFYHFTGYDSGAGRFVISHYTKDMPAISELWDAYDQLLKDNGQERLQNHKWKYGYFEDGSPITQHMREVYRDRKDLQEAFPDPFNADPENSFLKWYRENHVSQAENIDSGQLHSYAASYSWRLVGIRLYRLELFVRRLLQKQVLPCRLLHKTLVLFRDSYRRTRNKIQNNKKRINHDFSMNNVSIVHRKDIKDELSSIQEHEIPLILFDLFFCRGFHGAGEYGKSVFFSLCEKARKNEIYLWVVAKLDDSIENHVWELIAHNSINVIPVNNYKEISQLVNKDIFDFFFAPAIVVYTGYVYQSKCGGKLNFRSKHTKVIGAIHDIRDIELSLESKQYILFRKELDLLPECNMSTGEIRREVNKSLKRVYKFQKMYSNILSNRSVHKVVTVSNYSRDSIDKYLDKSKDKLITFYSPMKQRVQPERFEINGYDPASIRYALMINSARWEKNAVGAIIAFDRFLTENPKTIIKFIILGISDFSELGIQHITNRDKFILVNGYVYSGKLEYLYSNAQFLVYPSFSEGFGYPPLEIMSYGTPSLVSKRSAIPEICGESAVYCDPYHIESIQEGLCKIINDPPSKNDILARYQLITTRQQQDLEELVSLFRQAS